MNKVTVLIVLCVYAGAAYGDYCKDISGTWQNQLGSNMTIIRIEGDVLFGNYSTAVESKHRASSEASHITGTVTHLKQGALLAFTVLFNQGKSLTTWVGQCMVCDDEEVLYTTWVLRSYHTKPVDRWLSNTINQDTFKRLKEGSPNSIPRHLKMGPPEKVERSSECEQNLKVGHDGFWASESDAMKFSECYETGKLSGKYQSQTLHGRSYGGKAFTAVGLVTASPKEVKGWTGHIYEKSRENGRKVVASWLTHSYSDSCENPRAFVQYGVDGYSHDVNYRVTNEKNTKESLTGKMLGFIWSIFS